MPCLILMSAAGILDITDVLASFGLNDTTKMAFMSSK